MPHYNLLLISKSLLEIDRYRQYLIRGEINNPPRFEKTRQFVDYLGRLNEDFSSRISIWQAVRKTTGKNIGKEDELKEVLSPYLKDLALLANADLELFEYGSRNLGMERINEVSDLIISLSNQFAIDQESLKRC